MKNKLIILILLSFFSSLTIQALTIKIGSIAPARSPWDKALKQISREWLKISNGKVRLKIYPGGIAGSEKAMIRKMKIGTLSGALFTNVGLTTIYSDFYVLNIPMLMKSDQEFDYIFKNMQAQFEKEIEKKGYKILIWSMAGWIRFFTKEPVSNPEEMKRQKLSFTTGEPIFEQSWKRAGFNIIPTELKDLMMALQSGMVNAFFLPPLVAASGQYFALAPNMMSVNVAPVCGALAVSKKKWDRVPEEIREELLKSARKVADKLIEETRSLEQEAMETMRKNGLTVNAIGDGSFEKWQQESQKNVDYLKGRAFSDAIYQRLLELIQEFRKK